MGGKYGSDSETWTFRFLVGEVSSMILIIRLRLLGLLFRGQGLGQGARTGGKGAGTWGVK